MIDYYSYLHCRSVVLYVCTRDLIIGRHVES